MITAPKTLEEALSFLDQFPEAQIVSGGTDFMVEVNFGHRKVSDVLSLRNISELKTWTQQDGVVRIGAALPYASMETGPLAALLPSLAQAARTVGSPQIRAAGTIGGNLGTCSPAGDSLPVLFAHDATVIIAHQNGERRLPIQEFMVGPKRNALKSGEIVAAVEMVVPHGWQGYSKVGVRNAMVISVASACLVHDTASSSIRVAMGTVGPTILRASKAENWVRTQCDLSTKPSLSRDQVLEFGRLCESEATPITDHRSTAEYRKHAISVITSRLLERCSSK